MKKNKESKLSNPFKISEKRHKEIIKERVQRIINSGELAKSLINKIPQSNFDKELNKEKKWLHK